MRAVAVLLALVIVQLVPGARTAMATDDAPARAEAHERFERGLRLFEEGDNGGCAGRVQAGARAGCPTRWCCSTSAWSTRRWAGPWRPPTPSTGCCATPADCPPIGCSSHTARARSRPRVSRRSTVTTSVPAVIDVDGIEAGRTPLRGAPAAWPAGTHVIGALATGHLPSRREITSRAARPRSSTSSSSPTEARLAHLALDEHGCRTRRCWWTERWWDARRCPPRWRSPRNAGGDGAAQGVPRGATGAGARGGRDGQASTSTSRRIRKFRPPTRAARAAAPRDRGARRRERTHARRLFRPARHCPPAHTACGCNAPASSRASATWCCARAAETTVRMTLDPDAGDPRRLRRAGAGAQALGLRSPLGGGLALALGGGGAGGVEPAEPAGAGEPARQGCPRLHQGQPHGLRRGRRHSRRRCTTFARPGSTTPTAELSNRKVLRNISAVGAGVGSWRRPRSVSTCC